MWVRKKSRWSPWTASKTQGSLVIATLLDIQCFRRPARGRWLMTVRIQCKIIPGNRCGGLPFGWLEELAVGPFWHPFLGSWMKDETDWLIPPQRSPHLLKEVMQPRKTWVVWERFTTEAAWSKIFAVCDLVWIVASVHRRKRFLSVCGNSCEARGDRVPFELGLFRTASRLSEEVQRHYLVYEWH